MEPFDNTEKYFESQLPDEKVILLIRRHFLALLPYVTTAILIYFMGFLMVFVLPLLVPSLVQGFAYNVYILITSLVFFFNTAFLFNNWILHYLHVAILTDDHFVEIEQKGLFLRKVSQMSLDKIQDVSASQKGMIDTMFNIGTLDIQTAGEAPNFIMERVPNPNFLAQKIMGIEEEYCEKKGIRNNGIHSNANISSRIGEMVSDVSADVLPSPTIEYPVNNSQE